MVHRGEVPDVGTIFLKMKTNFKKDFLKNFCKNFFFNFFFYKSFLLVFVLRWLNSNRPTAFAMALMMAGTSPLPSFFCSSFFFPHIVTDVAFHRVMIECDVCNEWYHGECVHMTDEECEKAETFICPRCKNSIASLFHFRPTLAYV